MERVITQLRMIDPLNLLKRSAWEAYRLSQNLQLRFGVVGWIVLGSMLIILFSEVQRIHTIEKTKARQVINQEYTAPEPTPPTAESGRDRLAAFQSYLLPNEDIPNVLQDILQLAAAENLSISHGEYKPQINLQGQFMRYEMTLPVKGDMPSILHFMQAALIKQKNLALESVQFKRERVEANEVEARIQWVVVTTVPGNVDLNTQGSD